MIMMLSNIKEIKETNALGVNDYLKKNYTLLKILKICNKEEETIIYVLAK
jgi:hypothetical protein